MAEPTLPAAVATAVSAGSVAGVLTALGIEPAPLFWGLIGSTLGLSFAAPASRLRTLTVYLCAALSCAQLGHLVSAVYFERSLIWANSLALLLGLVFHPLMLAAVAAVPQLVGSAVGYVRRKVDAMGGGKP